MAFDYNKLIDGIDENKLLPLLKMRKKFKFMIEGIGRKI